LSGVTFGAAPSQLSHKPSKLSKLGRKIMGDPNGRLMKPSMNLGTQPQGGSYKSPAFIWLASAFPFISLDVINDEI
jgi:hypothetical protein